MARYIDADDFKREMEKYLPEDRELALKVLKSIKTADVAEVVRCKDCKHCEWYIKASYKNGVEVESHECRKYKMAVTRDWFCADGRRRDE